MRFLGGYVLSFRLSGANRFNSNSYRVGSLFQMNRGKVSSFFINPQSWVSSQSCETERIFRDPIPTKVYLSFQPLIAIQVSYRISIEGARFLSSSLRHVLNDHFFQLLINMPSFAHIVRVSINYIENNNFILVKGNNNL